ncbi:MAG: helix-turn-helix domain-containing protein [Pseudomonadota bacterium]
MAKSTRANLLETAKRLFSERGFYGVSIADIAADQGVTKQALLHHFSTKEKLYGEVLQDISSRFDTQLSKIQTSGEAADARFKQMLLELIPYTPDELAETRLLMRELLDNPQRAKTAGNWYLRPFLETLTESLKSAPCWSNASDAEALAAIYQVLGAINYFGISEATLTGIFGDDAYGELRRAFSPQLARLIDTLLANPPS